MYRDHVSDVISEDKVKATLSSLIYRIILNV